MAALPWITLRGNNVAFYEPAIDFASENLSNSRPSYIVFVGKLTKTILLDGLLGGPHHTGSLPVHKDVYLRRSPKLRAHRTPLVIIDSGVQNGVHGGVQDWWPPSSSNGTPATTWQLPVESSKFTSLMCARLFPVFSSVICYFVQDLGGLAAMAVRLAEQVTMGDPSTCEKQIRPRVLLVLQASSEMSDENIAAHKVLRLVAKALKQSQQCGGLASAQRQVHAHFAGLEVVTLQSDQSNAAQAIALRRRLLTMSKSSMQERDSAHALFSFRHFVDLSKNLLEHLCNPKSSQAFSLVRASRPCGFSTDLLEHCLTDFLEQIPSQAWLWHLVAPLVASALMLASYPPGAHEFSPDSLFKELYQAPCRAAISAYSANKQVQDQFLKAVLNEFNASFVEKLRSAVPTAELHRQNLKRLQPRLVDLKSHRSCFCCLLQMPEKVLACGHALCDSCVKIFGARSRTEKNSYKLSECLICGSSHQQAVFRFVPPTAGIRRLSVDGGGVKGIIPLMFLHHIDALLKPLGLPVQDYFDMVIGTSAGGLIVIGLFLLRWSVSECIQRFEDVAQKTFGMRATFLTRILRLLVAYIQDGQYSLEAIQGAFQKTLNSPLQMFNPLRNDTKVAVTTTSVKDSTLWLFTNYNAGKRPLSLGYNVARAERANDDISVGDAACCTSAAPWFFKPQKVRKIGAFQDGGLLHNCPSDITDWETRFVWPEKPDHPDIALSLGTGTSEKEVGETSVASKDDSGIGSRCLRRVIKIEFRPRYHRLNIQFHGHEPGLDDALKIPEMKNSVSQTVKKEKGRVAAVLDYIMASMFYFELDGPPILQNGELQCSGHIYCRADLGVNGRRHLYTQLRDTASWFLIQGNPTRCVDRVPRSLPPFKKRIFFRIKHESELITMSIRGITKTSRAISGFPTTLGQLIKCQRMNSVFGTVDHLVDERPLPAIPKKRTGDDLQEGRRNPKRACSSVYST